MYLVTVLLRGSGLSERSAELVGLFASSAWPEDKLEHVYCMPVSSGAAAAVFVLAASQSRAEATVSRLCLQIIDSEFPGAVLEYCKTALTLPLSGAPLQSGRGPDSLPLT